MIKIEVTDREGIVHSVGTAIDTSLMEAIRNAGLDELTAMCGGCCSCATCHVYIDNMTDKVGPAQGDEFDLLEMAAFLRNTSRLSCQVMLTKDLDGMKVTIAPEE